MTPEDLRVFCTSLGFTAVIMRQDSEIQNELRHTSDLVKMIALFRMRTILCLRDASNQNEIPYLDKAIEDLKSSLRNRGDADMQKTRIDLLQLYDRLRQRFSTYASDDMIADRVLELLDSELEFNAPISN